MSKYDTGDKVVKADSKGHGTIIKVDGTSDLHPFCGGMSVLLE